MRIGDRVTNARGWHGEIKQIDKSRENPYYWVHWQERENHKDKEVRRYPQCGHTAQQIWKDDREVMG